MLNNLEERLEQSRKITQLLEIIDKLENSEYNSFNVQLLEHGMSDEDNIVTYNFELIDTSFKVAKLGLIKQLKLRLAEMETNYKRILETNVKETNTYS